MSDTEPDEAPAQIDGADVEYVDPEPDETTGGDAVQMVGTGWIRFVIGDRRVRFRPARFGELRALMEGLDELNDATAERSEQAQDEAEVIEAGFQEFNASDATDVQKDRARRKAMRDAGIIARDLTRFTEEQRLAWWRTAHEMLGVSGEVFPPDEALPVWLLSPTLIQLAASHWRTVPLDRGRKAPAEG